MKIKSILFVIICSVVSFFSYSQESIEETQKIANDLFEEEKYVEATSYYLRLLALQPRDHNYNYRYGACLLHNAGKAQDVFKYLNYAITSDAVDIEANYFLGKAYHFNYQFNDALKFYKIYQTKVGSKPKASFDVVRQIQMCENGKKLITTITEMLVLDKKEIEKEKFFRIYDLNDIGGNLLVTAEFQTRLDEKKKHIPLIHFPENPNVIYYSSYGESGENGRDIYVQRRLPTGGWGLPQILKGGVNTKFDEDYPYMHPDGKYLYFSSKGHNSMGGYDVFRCMYNKDTDMFGKAENMDFAVSSPNDDLFYVVDSMNTNAFFASNRESTEGKLHVYKVRVDRVPLNMTVIKGDFNSTINPQMKKVWIDIKDYSNGEFIGNFSSNEKGVYLITFPKGGKYEYTIRVGESPQEYKYLATIPFQKEFKPLKQKIVHELMDGSEIVKVIDLFDESVEDPQAVFAKVIKMKSVLTPNVSPEELAKLERQKKDKEILTELGYANLSLVEFGYLLDEEIEDARRAEKGTKELENKLYAQVLDYTDEIKRLDDVIKRQLEKAEEATNDKKKFRTLKYAEKALKNQEELKKLSAEDLTFADSLSKIESSGSAAKTAEVVKYVEGFKVLLKDNKQAEAYAYLANNKDFLEKTIKEKAIDPLQALVERGLELDEEISRLQPIDDGYARDIKLIDAKIEELERSKTGAKKKDVEDIDAQISAKKNERGLIEDEQSFNALGLNKAVEERSGLRKKIDALEAIYTYSSDRVVSKQDALNAISTSNSTNSASVLGDVLSKLDLLIASNPNLKAVDYAELEAELGSIISDTRIKYEQLKNNPDLSPDQRAERLKALNAELLANIDKELTNTEKLLRNNPSNEDLRKKYEALNMARSLVTTALDLPDDRAGSAAFVASTRSTSTRTLAKNTVGDNNTNRPDRANQGNNAANGQGADAQRTLEANRPSTNNNGTSGTNGSQSNNANNSSNSTNSQELARNTPSTNGANGANGQTLATNTVEGNNNNGNNPELARNTPSTNGANGANGQTLATNTVGGNNNNGSSPELARNNVSNDGGNSNGNTLESNRPSENPSLTRSPLTDESKRDLLKGVDENYAASIASINSNSALSPLERAKAIQQQEEALLTLLRNEIAKEEATLKSNPSNEASRNRLADLKAVQTDLQSDIALRNSTIKNGVVANSSNQPLDARAKQTLIETVDPFYNEKYAQVKNNNSLSEVAKNSQLQKLDNDLLTSVNNEVAKETSKLSANPDDRNSSERLSQLKSVQNDLQSDITSREKALSNGVDSANSNKPLDARDRQELIKTIDPSYNDKYVQVKNNNGLSEVDRNGQLQKLDNDLLKSLKNEIAKETTKSNSNPADRNSAERLSQLKSVQNDLQSDITSREKALSNGLDSANSNKPLDARDRQELIKTIDPSYNDKYVQVKNNNGLSEVDRNGQLQKLDNDLLKSINNEIAKETTNSNPVDGNSAERLSKLKSVQNELEREIATKQPLLANSTSNNSNDNNVARNNLSDGNQRLDATTRASLLNQIDPNYANQASAIRNNTSFNDTEKNKALLELNRSVLSSIDRRIEVENNTISSNPNDKEAQNRLANFQSLRNEISTENNSIVAAASNDVATVRTNTLNEQQKTEVVKSVNPNYANQFNAIKSNTSLSEEQKLVELQKLDQSIVSQLSAKITKVKSGSDQQKLQDLETVKGEFESTIVSRETAISSMSKPLTVQEKKAIIESLSPMYNVKVDGINKNTSLNAVEKATELKIVNEELISMINKEIVALENNISSNPDPQLVKELKDLKSIKSELESGDKVNKKDVQLLSSVEKASLIKTINPFFDDKVKQIVANNALSDDEKNKQLLEQDKILIAAIVREEKVVSKALEQNPSSALNQKKMSDLGSLKTDIQSTISEREQIASNTNEPVNSSNLSSAKNEMITKLDPAYSNKVTAIQSNSTLSEVEKLAQLQKADEELLVKIDKAIQSTKAEDKATLSTLNQLKADTQTSITARKTLIASSYEPLDEKVKSEVIKSVDSKYQKSVDKVNQNNAISVNEKMNQLQDLDEKLLIDVEKSIVSEESTLAKNEADQDQKAKVANLKELKRELELDLTKRESVLASNSNVLSEQSKNELIATVSSSYSKQVNEIKNNDYLLDNEKAEKLQVLDQGLITSLKSEISKLEEKASTASTTEARKLEGLKTILSEKEAGIANRSKLITPTDNRLAEKSELIATFESNYSDEVKTINDNALIAQDEKLKQLQKVDEKLLVSIDKELKSATSIAKKKTASEEEKQHKTDLEELKQIAEDVIADRKSQIENVVVSDVSVAQKQEMIKDVRPGYKAKIDEINASSMNASAKMEALLNEEKELVNDLALKKTTLESGAKKANKNEDQAGQLNVLTASLNDSKIKVENLTQQTVTAKAQAMNQQALIAKVDPTFDTDVKTLLSSTDTEKASKLAAREKLLQENIKKQIATNEASNPEFKNLDIVAENQLLSQKVKESKKREENYQNGVIEVEIDDEDENSPALQALRLEILKDKKGEVLALYNEIDALKSQQATLVSYKKDVASEMLAVEKQLASDNTNETLLKRKKTLTSELKIIDKKAAIINGKISGYENASPVAKLTSPELERLLAEEMDLQAQLNNSDLSKKERATLEKELANVQTAKFTEQNQLMTDNIATRQKENSKLTSQLKQTASSSEMAKATAELATSQSERLSVEAEELLKQSEKTKKAQDKNELLALATEKQAEADEVVQMALEQNATSVAIANKVKTLDSKEELLAKKEVYENQLKEIDGKIESLETQIETAKKKKAAPLVSEKEGLESDKKLIEKQLVETERVLAGLKEMPLTVNEKALDATLSLNDEKEIIASKEYLEYSMSANKAIRLENQIGENEKMLAVAQQEAKAVIAKSLVKSNNVSEKEVQESVDKVKNIETEITRLTDELTSRQTSANTILANNSATSDKMQNLLKRGVEPIFNEALASIEQQRTPAEGLKISEQPIIAYTEANPIPVDVKLPSGLVYRVQVGAFSKPIAQDMYNSFSPISGEKISNGITRYMAGFFNNISTVEAAQGQVRSIGYEDAFIVAYCDNERITVAEARRLEASGQCISTTGPDFAIALATIPEGKSTKVDDLSYNQAPGAVKAVAVESHPGLFFTVQVGVYNKPATSKQLKEINPLVTKRLENGQIRYSSGMFTSVENALPKKADARSRGIKDAFVTAYYKGERISLTEASNLLKENGESILENVDGFIAKTETAKTPTDESVSYNKAPGSVPAKAAEAHKGLFFTVQIGVYSKPVTNATLNNVTPLITKQLDGGQIRYSSGMFKSIEEAEVKRTDVLNKGVKHAYITAYYEGERISLSEARSLLIQHGNSILEK